MARTQVDISYQSSRGAARSKVENYLSEKGFKQQMLKKGETGWRLNSKSDRSDIRKNIKLEVSDGEITLYAWLSGRDSSNDSIGEEDLSGFQRLHLKMQLRKNLRDIKKMF